MRHLFSILGGLLFVFGMFAFVTDNNPTGYKVGDKATDFKLKGVDGKTYSLADYKDAKGFIVIFTCNHCPFAIAYEDRIIALNNKYAPQGYPVIAINPNDPALQPEDGMAEMKVRAADKGFAFPYVMDEGQHIYPQYGATRTPHVFLLDADRIVQYIGAIDDNVNEPEKVKVRYVEDAIESLKSNKPIATTFTKAIGCSIKVKKG